jgi:hypothetical protein
VCSYLKLLPRGVPSEEQAREKRRKSDAAKAEKDKGSAAQSEENGSYSSLDIFSLLHTSIYIYI